MTISEEFDSAATRAVIAGLPGFDGLPEAVRTLLLDSFEPRAYGYGEPIVVEGEAADAFFVLVTGTARVLKLGLDGSEVPLNTLRGGDSFGEIGLLLEGTRQATVRPSSPVEALRLDRSIFTALLKTAPELRSWAEEIARRRAISDFLRVHTSFAQISPETLTKLVEGLEEVTVPAGEAIVEEGEPSGPMYVIADGRARVFVERDGARTDLGYLRPGDFFGERSLVHGEPRSATVQAVDECRLLRLPPSLLTSLLEDDEEFRVRVEQRVAQYDFRRLSRVPLDFADEILAADLGRDRAAQPEREVAEAEAEGTEPAALEPDVARDAKPIRRFPFVHQLDEADCGAACLAMICRHFGRQVGMPYIRGLARTGIRGTSLAGIVEAATGLGLDARGIRASKSRLDAIPLPAVLHVDGNHWIVLYRVEEDTARIADPARGLRRVPRQELLERWSGYAALVTYTEQFEETPEASLSLGWLVPFLRPHAWRLAGAAALALVAAVLTMVLPIMTKVIIDRVLPNDNLDLLWWIAGAIVLVLLALTGASLAERYLLSYVAVRADTNLLDFLTTRLLDLPPGYFALRQVGDIGRRLTGVRQVRQFFVQRGVQTLTAFTQLVVAVVVMLVMSWELALVYLATTPLYLGLMAFSSRRLRPMYDTLEETYGRYASQQIDAIHGIETVKAMAAEDSLRTMMMTQFRTLAQRVFRVEFLDMTYQGAIQLVSLLGFAVVLVAGAFGVVKNQVSLGTYVSFVPLIALAGTPIVLMLSFWDELQYARILVGRLDDVLEAEPEQGSDRSGLRPVTSLEGRLELRAVGFRYSPDSAPILDGITLDIKPGEKVAIVGRSGSGKTTLVRCLAGLLEPTEGTILFDGAELHTLDFRTLRRQIGFVLQENYLFNDTIARNIAFGEAEVDLDRVVETARAAHAHEFVQRLPLGYETRVGESGLRLSGGQRQRIAIARALYNDPPLLLLDEATSSLDAESERLVQESMDALLRDRTSVTIAHRLSTIRDADRIVVLEQGRVVEQGTHNELMDRRGIYFYLVSQQLEL